MTSANPGYERGQEVTVALITLIVSGPLTTLGIVHLLRAPRRHRANQTAPSAPDSSSKDVSQAAPRTLPFVRLPAGRWA
ncbi:MAG: hypothetical protein ACR2MZ_04345 [Candidatus Dormibacter sp.]